MSERDCLILKTPENEKRAREDGKSKTFGEFLDIGQNDMDRLAMDRNKTLYTRKSEEGEDVYDPFEHRNIDHPTSNFDTAIHLLNGNVGTGILAMPMAFKNGGLIVGTLGFVAIGIICVHTMHLLVNCSHELSKRARTPSLDFARVSELSFEYGPPPLRPFSKIARSVVDGVICVSCLGLCCVYYLFVVANLRLFILDQFKFDLSEKIYLIYLLPPLILLVCIRNLKFLAPVLFLANVCMALGILIILYYIIRDIPPIERRENLNIMGPSSFNDLAIYCGTSFFAFDGIGVVLPLENKMENPQDFGGWWGVLNICMVIAGILNIAVGVLGYLTYGSEAAGSITLNLPSGDWLAATVQIVLSLCTFLSYALQFYVVMSIAWPRLKKFIPEHGQWMTEYAARITLVLFTFALVEGVPNLGLGISFVGALCSTTLNLILPPMFSLCTHWTLGYGKGRWRMWKDLILIFIGLICCVVATYVSLFDIIRGN